MNIYIAWTSRPSTTRAFTDFAAAGEYAASLKDIAVVKEQRVEEPIRECCAGMEFLLEGRE
jgi:hypothetical protein